MHPHELPLDLGGYVLAGGQSSRMGQDKAMLPLAGKPMVEHAVTKLRRICRDVAILSNNAELGRFAPVVADLHPGCGPLSGLEAALAHSSHEWNLIVPVDVPFVPTAMLRWWASANMQGQNHIALFNVDGVPQPTLLIVHRHIAPYLTVALAQGRFKLFPVLEEAAKDLWLKRGPDAHDRFGNSQGMMLWDWTRESTFHVGPSLPAGPMWTVTTPEQEAAVALYFANLNTPEEFRVAERQAGLLDT